MEGLSKIGQELSFHSRIKLCFENQREKDYFGADKGNRESLSEILHDIEEIDSNFSGVDQKIKFSQEDFDDLIKLYNGAVKIVEENEDFLKQYAREEVEKLYSHCNIIEKHFKQKDPKNDKKLLLETNSLSYNVFKGHLLRLTKVFNKALINKLRIKLEAMPAPKIVVDIASKAKPVKELEKEQETRLEIKPEPKIKIEEQERIEEREVLKLEKKGFLTKDNIETATNLINSIVQECPDSTKYIVNGELNDIFTECREAHDIVQNLANEEAADDAWFPPEHVRQLQQMSERLRPRLRALSEAVELALEILPAEFPQLPKDNRIDYLMQVFARMKRNLEVKGMISIQDVYELEILKYELKWIVKNISNKENQLKTAEFIDWLRVSQYTPLFISINTANAGLRECIPMFPIEAMCWQEKGEIFWEEDYLDKLIFYKMIPAERDVKIFEFSYETIDWVPCENYEERSGLQDEYRKHLNQKQEQPISSSMSKKDIVIMDDRHYSAKHVNAKEKVAQAMIEINHDIEKLLSALPDHRDFPEEINAEHLPALHQDRAHIVYNEKNRSKFREGYEHVLEKFYNQYDWEFIYKQLDKLLIKLDEIMPLNEISTSARESRFFDMMNSVSEIRYQKNCTLVDLYKLTTQRAYLEGLMSLSNRQREIPDFIYWGWLRNGKDVTDHIEGEYKEGCIPFLIDNKEYRTCKYVMNEPDQVFECSWAEVKGKHAVDMRGFLNTEFGFWEIQEKTEGQWKIIDNERWPFRMMSEKPQMREEKLHMGEKEDNLEK